MIGLPKKYIKAYGVSKKAWRMYKASRSKIKSKGGIKMARKKRRARRYYPKKRSYRRSRSGLFGGGALMNTIVPAMAYGAAREKISNALAPFTNKIPLGTIADEAALATIAWFISKRARGGLFGSIAKAALVIESARIGEAMIDGSAFAGFRTTASTSGVPVV